MSQKTFTLQLVTVSKALFDGEAIELHCKGADGDMVVMANHEPLVTNVEKGDLLVRTADGKEETFSIEGGVLEVAYNKAVLLCTCV